MQRSAKLRAERRKGVDISCATPGREPATTYGGRVEMDLSPGGQRYCLLLSRYNSS